jgi:NitT/TauT family transport system substrate-binding protein
MKKFSLTNKLNDYRLMCAGFLLLAGLVQAEPLKIAYSDWMGYVPWDIAAQKGFFEKQGVEVELEWFEYMPSLNAFSAGQVDGVSIAISDSLVLTATGTRNILIMLHDFSNGNDQVIAKPGITSFKDLKGKKIGVSLETISHAFLLKALELNGMTEDDVELVNMANEQAALVFAADEISAVVGWQPATGQALSTVARSTVLTSSREVKGLIYDGLIVSPQSLRTRHDDWQKVVNAWFDVMEFMRDPANEDECLKILSSRISITPEEYHKLLDGTYLVNKQETIDAFNKDASVNIYTAQNEIDEFFVNNGIYEENINFERDVDESLVRNAK